MVLPAKYLDSILLFQKSSRQHCILVTACSSTATILGSVICSASSLSVLLLLIAATCTWTVWEALLPVIQTVRCRGLLALMTVCVYTCYIVGLPCPVFCIFFRYITWWVQCVVIATQTQPHYWRWNFTAAQLITRSASLTIATSAWPPSPLLHLCWHQREAMMNPGNSCTLT